MDASDDNDERMNKVQRLAVAGVIAPFVREGHAKARQRRVTKVDKDGNVVGYTTLAEVQKSLLEKHAIEIAVVEGKRPKEIICEKCGKPERLRYVKGKLPSFCQACRTLCICCGAQKGKLTKTRSGRCKACSYLERSERLKKNLPACVDCGKRLSRELMKPSRQARRNGRPPRCSPCSKPFRGPKPIPRPKCVDCGASVKGKDAKRCLSCSIVDKERIEKSRRSISRLTKTQLRDRVEKAWETRRAKQTQKEQP